MGQAEERAILETFFAAALQMNKILRMTNPLLNQHESHETPGNTKGTSDVSNDGIAQVSPNPGTCLRLGIKRNQCRDRSRKLIKILWELKEFSQALQHNSDNHFCL